MIDYEKFRATFTEAIAVIRQGKADGEPAIAPVYYSHHAAEAYRAGWKARGEHFEQSALSELREAAIRQEAQEAP